MECEICHQKNSGLHYNAICCRACAAFFRRTIQQKLRYRCRRNGSCNLRKETRYCCRFCRMKRCIAVGMTMDDSSGLPYNFHLDSSAQTPPVTLERADVSMEAEEEERENGEKNVEGSREEDFYSTEYFKHDNETILSKLKARLSEILDTKPKRRRLPYKLSLFQQAAIAYEKHGEKWPNCTKERIVRDEIVDIPSMLCDYLREFENVAKFCMEIEEFANLPLDQKTTMLKRFSTHFINMDRCFVSVNILGTDREDHGFVTLGGSVLDMKSMNINAKDLTDLTEEEIGSVFMTSRFKFQSCLVKPFKNVVPDDIEMLYLLLAEMWNLEGKKGISQETLHISRKLRERLSEELYFYYKFEKNLVNYASRIYKLHNILNSMDTIDESRAEDHSMSKTFNLFKVDIHLYDLTQ